MGLIIFDFDGTLVDSLQMFVEAANRLAHRFSYPPIPNSDVSYLRTLSSREVLQRLPFPRWQLPFFLRYLRRDVNQRVLTLSLFDGIEEVLFTLKQQGESLGIVTSNSQATVQAFLKEKELLSLFDFIHGGQLLGKQRILRQLVHRRRLKTHHVICIGDETRDIEAAQQARLLSIAVSWGFNSRAILAQHQPDRLVDDPQQLLAAIHSLRTGLH